MECIRIGLWEKSVSSSVIGQTRFWGGSPSRRHTERLAGGGSNPPTTLFHLRAGFPNSQCGVRKPTARGPSGSTLGFPG